MAQKGKKPSRAEVEARLLEESQRVVTYLEAALAAAPEDGELKAQLERLVQQARSLRDRVQEALARASVKNDQRRAGGSRSNATAREAMPNLAPFKEDDYPAILHLTRQSMEPILRDALGIEFNEDLFHEMLADEETTTLVMREGGSMVGYVAFYPREEHLFVNWLVVHPDYRNRGFATMLLDEVGRIAAQRGLRALRICLQDINQPAIALCERAGFRRISHDPMGWIMEKTVAAERAD